VKHVLCARHPAIARCACTTCQPGPKGVLEICKILGLGATELDRVIGPRVEAAVFELNARRVTNGVEIGQLV